MDPDPTRGLYVRAFLLCASIELLPNGGFKLLVIDGLKGEAERGPDVVVLQCFAVIERNDDRGQHVVRLKLMSPALDSASVLGTTAIAAGGSNPVVALKMPFKLPTPPPVFGTYRLVLEIDAAPVAWCPFVLDP